jgi:hypothetical protein
MAESAGFWSYVHDDDTAEGGRILSLATRLTAMYEMNTAGGLQLFVDRTSIQWGDAWKERIDAAVAGTTFFIPIITPRYFQSAECRRELLSFWAQAQRSDVPQLLLPVYYATVPEMENEPSDEAMVLVASRQWVDLRELRFVEEESADYRKTVNLLAERISAIADEVSTVPERSGPDAAAWSLEKAVTVPLRHPDSVGSERADVDETEALDGLESLAEMEERLPKLGEILTEISGAMELVTEVTKTATADVNRSDAEGRGFGGRLAATQRYAQALEEPAQRLRALGEKYASELVKTDPGLLTMLEWTREALDSGEAPGGEERQSVILLMRSIEETYRSAVESNQSLREMLANANQTAKLSRSLRRPVAAIQAGLRGISDGERILEKWASQAREIREKLEPSQPE